jgi:hypothetical protein
MAAVSQEDLMQSDDTSDLKDFICATASALNAPPEQRAAWQSAIQAALQEAQAGGEETRSEVELFNALNDLLAGKAASLPDEHIFAGVLAEVRAQSDLESRSDEQLAVEILNAVQELLAAEDWQDTRQVMENKQRILFLSQTDDLFKVFLRQAQAQKDEESAKVLRLHQRLVQLARQDGIPAAFTHLEAALKG